MTVTAEVLADSVHPRTGSRLTTMRIRYPRFVHAELLTHRMFARNASSSRAIPSARQRAAIRRDPALPLSFGANQKGMQQGADLSPLRSACARLLWLGAMHVALVVAALLDRLGVHKQIVNRIPETWSHITVILTGTDVAYANFYKLRRHEAAEPTIHALADEMARAHRASAPRTLEIGEWHLPLVRLAERGETTGAQIIRSVARTARTSYDKPDSGKPSTFREDLELCQRLLDAQPMHASPAEHQARADFVELAVGGCFGRTGWTQYRKTLPGECFTRLGEVIQ